MAEKGVEEQVLAMERLPAIGAFTMVDLLSGYKQASSAYVISQTQGSF